LEGDEVSNRLDGLERVRATHLYVFVAVRGLASALWGPSVVMMGFRSVPFLLFFPPLPLAAAFAAAAAGFALFMFPFLTSPPFIIALCRGRGGELRLPKVGWQRQW
jgi:hypothetical protein